MKKNVLLLIAIMGIFVMQGIATAQIPILKKPILNEEIYGRNIYFEVFIPSDADPADNIYHITIYLRHDDDYDFSRIIDADVVENSNFSCYYKVYKGGLYHWYAFVFRGEEYMYETPESYFTVNLNTMVPGTYETTILIILAFIFFFATLFLASAMPGLSAFTSSFSTILFFIVYAIFISFSPISYIFLAFGVVSLIFTIMIIFSL